MELPEPWETLSEREHDRLLCAGVYDATRARVRQLQAEIAECEQHMHRFEDRYGMFWQRFKDEQIAGLDMLQVHEDYNDWFYRQTVLNDKQCLLATVSVLPASP